MSIYNYVLTSVLLLRSIRLCGRLEQQQNRYNNVEVLEYLLERGADVNAQDKGGLIPLHNASSYGHLDIAALLIK